jgi:hypothetical protein
MYNAAFRGAFDYLITLSLYHISVFYSTSTGGGGSSSGGGGSSSSSSSSSSSGGDNL